MKKMAVDTSRVYVRGAEILGDWKPKGVELIAEHQQMVAKFLV